MVATAKTSDLKDAMKGTAEWVSPVNALVLAAVTLLDICAPAFHGRYVKVLALMMAVAVIAIALRLNASRRELDIEARSPGRVLRRFLTNRFNLGLLVAMAGTAAFFTANVAWAEADEGAVAGVVPSLKTLQMSLFKLDHAVVRLDAKTDRVLDAVAPTDPAGKLNLRHYGMDNESKARAIESCDVDAVKQYLALGEMLPLATPVFGQRAGSNLERPIMEKNPRLPVILDLLSTQHGDLNSRTLLTFVAAQTGEIPQFDALASHARHKNRAIGPMFMPSNVRVTLLVLAIWASNTQAIDKLLALGADPAVGIDAQIIAFSTDGRSVQQNLVQIQSAAQEAKRLGVTLSR